MVEWAYAGSRPLAKPFFDQSASLLMQEPFNLLFQQRTPLPVLLDWAAASPGIPPSGFIFHLSRCGSTLVSRMLAALTRNVVVSEAPPVNTLLRAMERMRLDETERIVWLRALMSALGQKRTGEENQFYVKFDNASTLDLALIRKAFPEVPWIFLHRDPVEVMVSQLDNPAPHMMINLSDAGVPGLSLAEAVQMPQAEYCARMLGAICNAALTALREPDSKGLAVDYRELPDVMWTKLGHHWGAEWSADDLERMRAVVPFHAKNPSATFADDKESKQKRAGDEVRKFCTEFAEPPYAAIRQL